MTKIIAALIATAAAAATTQGAWAQGPEMIVIGKSESQAGAPRAIPSERRPGSHLCGPFDPDCAIRLGAILTRLPNVLPAQVTGGVRYGEDGAQGAVKFSTQLLSLDVPKGDLKALLFDAIYLPDAGGFRLRFALADSDVLFFCKDDEGVTHPPLASLAENCRPEGIVGLGGKLTQVQWDAVTSRVVARWLELNAVLNFLRNGNGFDYLRKRLNGFLGLSVDTVWAGDAPGAERRDRHSVVRANMGISGMLRTRNNQWEIRGLAGYRPNVAAWDDYSIEARTKILHHMLLSDEVMGDIGIDAQYQYNTVPSRSMGEFASDRERHSAYLGAIFGVTWR